jgi:hypothetical protein
MDITTVNDRHLYQGKITVKDPEDGTVRAAPARQVIRFGPPGWVTVADGVAEGDEITLYPTSQVLSVSELREVGTSISHPTPGT